MASVLDGVKPLAALLTQAPAPVALAHALTDAVCTGAITPAGLIEELTAAVRDGTLVMGVLVHAGVLTRGREWTPGAAVRLGQAAALVELDRDSGWRLVLTVPTFLRGTFDELVVGLSEQVRPVQTARAVGEVAAAAGQRLLIAAPYLHTGFVKLLGADVERVLAGGGEVLLISQALSLTGPRPSDANTDAVAVLRAAAERAGGTLTVRSWEESGLGVHFKVVAAVSAAGVSSAYIGSSNATPSGAFAHAEAGVLAHGEKVEMLIRWLDGVAAELARRRLPSS